MNCSSDDVPTNVVKDFPATDDSSDDEPLIKLKISAQDDKPVTKDNTSTRINGTKDKKADLKTDDSSDNEPLIKIAKVAPKAAKKPFTMSPKKSVDIKKKESLNDSSDDEPLSELVKKRNSRGQRKAPVRPSPKETPVMKSTRNVAKKTVKYAESSSDSSDHESLATMKKKMTKVGKELKNLASRKKTKVIDKSLKDPSSPDGSSSDDDVPLAKLVPKKKPAKKNTKTTTASQVSASRKRRGLSDEISEDEPLINLVEKKRKETKKRTPKKRDTNAKKPGKTLVPESSGNSSEDEPLVKAAKHPQVTKILRVILKRCDGEERATRNLENTTTDKEKASCKESEESSEEE